jgi:hypothetical protein
MYSVGRDNVVVIAACYVLDGPGIESQWGARYAAPVQTCPWAQPASYTMGTGSFLGVKQPGRGVDHPPHLAPRLKKELRYTVIFPLGLRGCSKANLPLLLIMYSTQFLEDNVQ